MYSPIYLFVSFSFLFFFFGKAKSSPLCKPLLNRVTVVYLRFSSAARQIVRGETRTNTVERLYSPRPEILLVTNASAEGNVDSICTNVWRNTKCGTEVLKYFFNSATNTCQPFKYYSCLGNENKFDSLEQCNEMCGQNTKQKREISNRTRMVSKTKANHFETIVQRLNDVVRQPSR